MKKTLSRSLLANASVKRSDQDEDENGASTEPVAQIAVSSAPPPGRPAVGGAGSAWKAGAAEQNRAALNQHREKTVKNVLAGRHELILDPSQVVDRLGTDRRDDWQDQKAFESLKASIEQNGQDTPIQVWPAKVDWSPDPLDPENVKGIQFELITGRRRHAIATVLGRPLRAILASPDKRGAPNEHFEMLFIRFRENEERENLGPFERLLSIGEMFEDLTKTSSGPKPTAVSFAERIGVHESIVSRGRTVFKSRAQILNKFKNAYDMSFPELQKAVSSLTQEALPKAKAAPKPKKITVKRKVGSRNLLVSTQAGRLSVSAAGMNLDKQSLEGLGDVIAAYLAEQEPRT